MSNTTPGNKLEDSSPMPYGKHQGTRMEDVPASYLHYLWENGLKSDKVSNVADYIRRSMSALQMEHPDGVWSKP